MDQENRRLATFQFGDNSNQSSVAIELSANKPFVQIQIGDGTYWFILDTGAAASALDTEVAKSLNISLRSPWQASGAGEGTLRAEVGSKVSLNIGSLELCYKEIDVIPLNSVLFGVEGRRVDGLLGYDFFEQFAVEIDYVNGKTKIRETKENLEDADSNEEKLDLDLVRGSILTAAEFAPLEHDKRIGGTFLIDTAWRSALTFTSPFVASNKLLSGRQGIITSMTGIGIGGQTLENSSRIASFRLGRFSMKNLIANFSQAKAGILSQADFSGIIGAEILRRFKVTFDYPNRSMFLSPNKNLRDPFEFGLSGLFLIAEGSFGKIKIKYVVENSAGAVAGAKVGDELVSIDNVPVSSFTLDDIRSLFRKEEGREYRLVLMRDRERIQTPLVLKRNI